MEGTEEEENALVKLRRLRLEETKLTSIINKAVINLFSEGNTKSDSKSIFIDLKESYINLTRLLEDIKHSINKEEQIQELDINDFKKDVLELENNIKSLKLLINSHLKMKVNEIHSIEKIKSPIIEDELTKHELRIKVKPFNEIVPSPVRAIINSPFKSKEVQEYQEFMKNNRNRYGGWNEFNHNIFVQSWNKHFAHQDIESNFHEPQIFFDHIINSSLFQDFIRETQLKITGASVESVIIHSKWYSQYLYYYKRQQKAINVWRCQKNKINNLENCVLKGNYKNREERIEHIKKIKQDLNSRWLKRDELVTADISANSRSSTLSNESINFDPIKNDGSEPLHIQLTLNADQTKKESRKEFIKRLARPSKYNVSADQSHCYKYQNDISTIPKLQKPHWRLDL